MAQCNVSFNRERGSVRGMHWQTAPHEEAKLIWCVRGAVYDVALDLRADSTTRGQWQNFELREEERTLLFLPGGVAHGYQTLLEDTELFYWMSEPYVAALQRGVRWNDPAFDIQWPLPVRHLSERDQSFTDWEDGH